MNNKKIEFKQLYAAVRNILRSDKVGPAYGMTRNFLKGLHRSGDIYKGLDIYRVMYSGRIERGVKRKDDVCIFIHEYIQDIRNKAGEQHLLF